MFPRIDPFLFPFLVVLLLGWRVVESLDCPAGQIARGNETVCCVPVFNCPKDHEIVECTGPDDIKDRCVPCRVGEINNHVTSSVDDSWTKYRCFIGNTTEHKQCSPDDALPFSSSLPNCALQCECDIYKCYYGNQCGCKRAKPCEAGKQLNTTSGECVACQAHTYKARTGCQACTWNETSWRLSLNLPIAVQPVEDTPAVIAPNDDKSNNVKDGSTPLTTDGTSKIVIATGPKEPVTSETKDDGSEDGGVPVIPIVIIIVLLVIGAVVVAIALFLKKKIRDGDQNSRLVVFYNKLKRKDGNQPDVQPDVEMPLPTNENGVEIQRPQQVVEQNGVEIQRPQQVVEQNGVEIEKPQQAVKPMQQIHPVQETQDDSIPFAEMSLNASRNEQNESTIPLMSSETKGDEPAETTETKSV